MPSSKPVKTSKPGKKKPRGKPFKKNDPITGERDERINRDGQNAKYTEFHRMLARLFDEPMPYQGGTISMLEVKARQWMMSGEFQKENKLFEYYMGKVPDVLTVNTDVETFVRDNITIFTDGQLDRLAAGENPWTVIAELLKEIKEAKQGQ